MLMTCGKQRPEQHGQRCLRRNLRLDASLELLVEPLDRVRGSCATLLAGRQAGEGEEAVATVDNGTMLEPPLANEGLAARLDLLGRGGVDHVGVIGVDVLVQALGRMREQIPVLVNRASLHWHAVPDRGDRFVQPRCTIDDEELGRRKFNIGRNIPPGDFLNMI
jgi:hypothetical protein